MQEHAIINKNDNVGKAANNPELKQLLNSTTPDYKLVENTIKNHKNGE